MVSGPGEELEAARRGHLRAAHADRDRVISTLKVAFVQGRLDKDEFDLRVAETFAARTYADLDALTSDLPGGLAVAHPPAPVRAEGWLTMERAVTLSACMVIPTAAATVAGWMAVGRPHAGAVILLSLLAFFVATVAAGTMIGEAFDKSRRSKAFSRGPGPGAGGHVSASPLPDVSGTHFPADDGSPPAAEAMPSRRASRPLPGFRSARPCGPQALHAALLR